MPAALLPQERPQLCVDLLPREARGREVHPYGEPRAIQFVGADHEDALPQQPARPIALEGVVAPFRHRTRGFEPLGWVGAQLVHEIHATAGIGRMVSVD